MWSVPFRRPGATPPQPRRRGPTPVALERNRPSSAAISTCRSARVTSSRPRSAAAPWATSTSTAPATSSARAGTRQPSFRAACLGSPHRKGGLTGLPPSGGARVFDAGARAAVPSVATEAVALEDGPRASLAPGAATAEPVRARQPRRGASWADVPGGVALESAPGRAVAARRFRRRGGLGARPRPPAESPWPQVNYPPTCGRATCGRATSSPTSRGSPRRAHAADRGRPR